MSEQKQSTDTRRYLSVREAVQISGLSRTTLFRLERDRLFPRRRQLGPNRVGYISNEIYHWIETRPTVTTQTNSDG